MESAVTQVQKVHAWELVTDLEDVLTRTATALRAHTGRYEQVLWRLECSLDELQRAEKELAGAATDGLSRVAAGQGKAG